MNQEVVDFLYEVSEENIYDMLDIVKDNSDVDKVLIYCFIKALYLHVFQDYNYCLKKDFDLENIYSIYKDKIKEYFLTNNPTITDEFLDYIYNFFDNSFSLIDAVEITDIEDGYDFRHYIINLLELLRLMLENKSNVKIRENIFENYPRMIVEKCDKIYTFIASKKKN